MKRPVFVLKRVFVARLGYYAVHKSTNI
jgi:hypothetical protein